ncbi:unnamed protein product [Closterium sp. Yama58-4]|nr:unnamed protein product [Closterium sp. Yama58-4]
MCIASSGAPTPPEPTPPAGSSLPALFAAPCAPYAVSLRPAVASVAPTAASTAPTGCAMAPSLTSAAAIPFVRVALAVPSPAAVTLSPPPATTGAALSIAAAFVTLFPLAAAIALSLVPAPTVAPAAPVCELADLSPGRAQAPPLSSGWRVGEDGAVGLGRGFERAGSSSCVSSSGAWRSCTPSSSRWEEWVRRGWLCCGPSQIAEGLPGLPSPHSRGAGAWLQERHAWWWRCGWLGLAGRGVRGSRYFLAEAGVRGGSLGTGEGGRERGAWWAGEGVRGGRPVEGVGDCRGSGWGTERERKWWRVAGEVGSGGDGAGGGQGGGTEGGGLEQNSKGGDGGDGGHGDR